VCARQDNEKKEVCSCDPGVREFQTVYSKQEVFSIGIRKEIKERLLTKIDRLRGFRSRKNLRNRKNKKIKTNKLVRYEKACYDRYHNLTTEMHYQLAHYLTSNYKVIVLPPIREPRYGEGQETKKVYQTTDATGSTLSVQEHIGEKV
jgi:putative transposase